MFIKTTLEIGVCLLALLSRCNNFYWSCQPWRTCSCSQCGLQGYWIPTCQMPRCDWRIWLP